MDMYINICIYIYIYIYVLILILDFSLFVLVGAEIPSSHWRYSESALMGPLVTKVSKALF